MMNSVYIRTILRELTPTWIGRESKENRKKHKLNSVACLAKASRAETASSCTSRRRLVLISTFLWQNVDGHYLEARTGVMGKHQTLQQTRNRNRTLTTRHLFRNPRSCVRVDDRGQWGGARPRLLEMARRPLLRHRKFVPISLPTPNPCTASHHPRWCAMPCLHGIRQSTTRVGCRGDVHTIQIWDQRNVHNALMRCLNFHAGFGFGMGRLILIHWCCVGLDLGDHAATDTSCHSHPLL